jgi:hypothetical protein
MYENSSKLTILACVYDYASIQRNRFACRRIHNPKVLWICSTNTEIPFPRSFLKTTFFKLDEKSPAST